MCDKSFLTTNLKIKPIAKSSPKLGKYSFTIREVMQAYLDYDTEKTNTKLS